MKKFKYMASQPHLSTILITGEDGPQKKELRLFEGVEAELPHDHPVIAGLIAAGHLKEVGAKPNSNNSNK